MCLNNPELKIVRSSSNSILEVLAFIGSCFLFFDTISTDDLPFAFTYADHSFTLARLEPLFIRKPKSLIQYPFESQGLHLQRVAGKHDSQSSRIPILLPHSTNGGPRASDFINFISMSQLPECDPIISYLFFHERPYFYVFLSPLQDNWTENLNFLFPTKPLQLHTSSLEELPFHTPHFILLETLPDVPYPIPCFDESPIALSKQGWITVSGFSTSYLLLLTPTTEHVKILIKFLNSHTSLFSSTLQLGFFPGNVIPLSPTPSENGEEPEDEPMDCPPAVNAQTDLPDFCPSLLLCYRILSYVSWDRNYDHIRQRLMEAVAGGLHSSAPSVLSILQKALDSFHSYTFVPLPDIMSFFTQLCQRLPSDLQIELFPKLVIDHVSSIPYFLPLSTFPHASTSAELAIDFSRIFLYLPSASLLVFAQTSLLFTSPEFQSIQLSHFLELLSSNFTITEDAKANTAEKNRPIVLKFCSILLKPFSNLSPFNVPPLLVEQYHSDLESVTIDDPTAGVHIVPLSHLLLYHVCAIHFKRGSKSMLICPKLIQRFASLPLPQTVTLNAAKFSIISLFDGSGSFTDVIAKALNQWPHAILAAENDPGTRAVVSKVKGWPLDGTLWSLDKNGAHSFYAKDVWLLIQDNCQLLRQFLSLLPPDSTIFVAAGFPCPDLTIIGRGKGVLGVAGDRSVLLRCGWAVLYFLSLTPFWPRVVVLFENAGSMQEHMKKYIHQLLGIPISCAHYINCAQWGSVSRARYFFSTSNTPVLPTSSPSPFPDNWSPVLDPGTLKPRPLPPWLRPRRTTDKGSVVQSPLAYHPRNLLYDTTFFGGPTEFRAACMSNHPTLYPRLPFENFLPEFLWSD